MNITHPIELYIRSFLEQAQAGPLDIDEQLIEEFGENCKEALRKQFVEQYDDSWRLRMSNVGRPIRQLHLEKEYGPSKKPAEFKFVSTYGDLVECLMMFVLKASGVNVTSEQERVSLKVSDTDINGTYDLTIDGEVWDIKSASPYAFDNKFSSYDRLKESDDFGYLSQGYGYAKAADTKFAGLILINKVNGSFKVLTTPDYEVTYNTEADEYYEKMVQTVKHFENDEPIPECQGVVEETFYQKPTGNYVLTGSCMFCDYKEQCHKNCTYEPDRSSKAKKPKMKWYVNKED